MVLIMRVPAGEFKTHCLELITEVSKHRREVIITKHGKPVAKLVSFDETPQKLFGLMADTGVITGDIVSPTDAQWDADA